MHILAGLGNPGEKYVSTRHNIGFHVVESIANSKQLTANSSFTINKPLQADLLTGKIHNKDAVLVKPLAYMNNSGIAVKKIISQFPNFSISDLIVVHDDITLELGTVKISVGAGSGNHNGVQSIIDHLKTKKFIRVRCGVGRGMGDLHDVVLSNFTRDEKKIVEQEIKKAAQVCAFIVKHGVEKAMNRHNQ